MEWADPVRQLHKTLIRRKKGKQLHWIGVESCIGSHTLSPALTLHCKISSSSSFSSLLFFHFSQISSSFPLFFSITRSRSQLYTRRGVTFFLQLFQSHGAAGESKSPCSISIDLAFRFLLSDRRTCTHSLTSPLHFFLFGLFLDPAWWQNKQKFLQDAHCSAVCRRPS